ncbi:MAG TPA: hypothetical protein VLW50_30130 [Streptosporangiaceae bacterium]|nr:hypothetical protein [Streptosporangiaceae bacterium]
MPPDTGSGVRVSRKISRGGGAPRAEVSAEVERPGHERAAQRSRPAILPGGSAGRAGMAFRLGDDCERLGDLEGAITWFRRAAEADHPDAAMRLGGLLGRLIDQRSAGNRAAAEHHQARRTDLTMMAEATRWLAAARGSHRLEMMELVLLMLDRQQALAAGHLPGAPAAGSLPCHR